MVLGRDDVGLSYAALPEVREALAGRTATVLRQRGDYQPRYWVEFLSRAAGIRVHHVRPVIVGGEVVGAIMVSRSPRGLFLGIYQDRGRILLGTGLIFGTLVAPRRPALARHRPADRGAWARRPRRSRAAP